MVLSIKTLGLLLQSTPYLGKKKIFKIFTPEQGLITLFAKTGQLSPFCFAEWVLQATQKEIYPLQDATLLDPLLHLRENYSTLLAAGSIAQDLLRTQMPGKKACELFDLALFYFRKLATSPAMLAASFRLKLLLHEGLLSSEPHPSFTIPEWEQVQVLAFSRKLSAIQALTNAPCSKIELLFTEKLSS